VRNADRSKEQAKMKMGGFLETAATMTERWTPGKQHKTNNISAAYILGRF
jgi:hypothetical protein